MCSRVYIGHLPYDARERDLEDFFDRYGPLRDIVIKDGYGFVEFYEPRDAEDAAYYQDGKRLLGERVSVELVKRPPRGRDVYRTSGTRYLAEEHDRKRDPYDRYSAGRSRGSSRSYSTRWRIRVENLSTGVSWQDLKDFMREAGEVTYVDAHSKYEREGIVCFATEREMYRALHRLDGANLNGRRIRLINDTSPHRSTSYSRSPSRPYSRSRTGSRSGTNNRSRSRSRSYTRSRSSTYSRSRSRSPTRSPSPMSRSPSRDRSATPMSRSPSSHGNRSPDREADNQE